MRTHLAVLLHLAAAVPGAALAHDKSAAGKGHGEGHREVHGSHAHSGKCTLSRADEDPVPDEQESVVLHLHQNVPGRTGPLNMKFVVRKDTDFVSQHIKRTGQVLCDDLLLNAMSSVLAKHTEGASANRKRPLFVDVGSNIGSCTAVAGLLGFDVIAVEPNPANMQFVKKNILLNNLADSVRVLPCGLSNATMDLTFRYTTGNMGMGTFGALPETYMKANKWGKWYDASRTVPVTRMDNVPELRRRPIDLMKVDTEGHEGRVIRGAGAMLDHGQLHTMYLEDHFAEGASDTESMSSIQELLVARGYRLVAQANIRGYLYASPRH